MNYKCHLCEQTVDEGLVAFQEHTDRHIVNLIKHDHPQWVEQDGACRKCYEYYKAEINGSIFHDAPCAIRMRWYRKIFPFLKK